MLMSVFAAGWVGNCYAAGDPLCYPILSSWIMAGALVMAMGASFVTLMAAQFVTSLRVRFARVVTAVYNAEISPVSTRSLLSSLLNVCVPRRRLMI